MPELFWERDDCRGAGEPDMDEFAVDPESVRVTFDVFRSLHPDIPWIFKTNGNGS